MRYYIIVGEASGDIYGAELIKEIKRQDSTAEVRFWGGNKMLKAEPNIAMHIRETAFMGFWEVIKNLSTIRKLFAFCKKDMIAFKPDYLICIDYPGFNLRMIEWAKPQGIKTIYYIAPQLWAWKKSRYKKIKAFVDKLIVILPFEKGFYKGLGISSSYFGHPLSNSISFTERPFPKNKPQLSIALLAGSRKQELQKHLPVFKQLCEERAQDLFTLALAPEIGPSDITSIIGKIPDNMKLVEGKTLEILSSSDIAIVKSGTSTLEAALSGVPQMVIYKTSWLSYQIGKRVVKLPWIAIVNIIAGKQVVPEYVQHDFTVEKLNDRIHEMLTNPAIVETMKKQYLELRESLEATNCYKYTVEEMLA